METKKDAVISVDLGGTNTKAGLVTNDGKIVARAEVPSGISEGMPVVERRIIELIKRLMAGCGEVYSLTGIGLCCPGVVNPFTGMVLASAPNIPGLAGYPLAANIKKALLQIPLGIMNDAKAAALGEASYGAGVGGSTVAFFGLGTGAGFGTVLNGKVYQGANYEAGEVGHSAIPVDFEYDRKCVCGRHGCVEAYLGTVGFLRTWMTLRCLGIETGYSPEIGQENIKDVFQYAKRGDILCLKAVKESSRHLAIAMAQVISHWNPDVFVIGGQIARDGDFFIPFVREELDKLLSSQPGLLRNLKIVPGKYPADAGFLGAAKNVFDMVAAR